jgi:hypothetical protein
VLDRQVHCKQAGGPGPRSTSVRGKGTVSALGGATSQWQWQCQWQQPENFKNRKKLETLKSPHNPKTSFIVHPGSAFDPLSCRAAARHNCRWVLPRQAHRGPHHCLAGFWYLQGCGAHTQGPVYLNNLTSLLPMWFCGFLTVLTPKTMCPSPGVGPKTWKTHKTCKSHKSSQTSPTHGVVPPAGAGGTPERAHAESVPAERAAGGSGLPGWGCLPGRVPRAQALQGPLQGACAQGTAGPQGGYGDMGARYNFFITIKTIKPSRGVFYKGCIGLRASGVSGL